MLVLTGTKDSGLDGDWRWRATAYAPMPPGCKWLGVVDGATHINFAGHGFSRRTAQRTVPVVTAFLDSVRGGSCVTPAPPPGVTRQSK